MVGHMLDFRAARSAYLTTISTHPNSIKLCYFSVGSKGGYNSPVSSNDTFGDTFISS